MGYRSGPSSQDVQLAEPADMETVQAEPADHAPQTLASLEEGLDCQVVVRPFPEPLTLKELEQDDGERVAESVLEEREEVKIAANYVPGEDEVEEPNQKEVLVCPPSKSPVCQDASHSVHLSTVDSNRPEIVITLVEEEDGEAMDEKMSQVTHVQKVNMPRDQEPELPAIIELDPASPADPESQSFPSDGANNSGQQHNNKMTPDATVDLCLSPASHSAPSPIEQTVTVLHKPLVPCYWSLELLIAAAFCTDVPPFPLFSFCTPTAAPSQYNHHQGMKLLCELADLEQQQQKRMCGKSQGEEQLIFHYSHILTCT